MITELRLILAGIVLGALLVGGWWLHHSGFEAGIAHCQAVTAKAQAKAQQTRNAQLAKAASVQSAVTQQGAVTVDQSHEATHETVHTITRVVHDHPAPATCLVQPGSVRALQRAVSAANAAAGSLRITPAGAASAARP